MLNRMLAFSRDTFCWHTGTPVKESYLQEPDFTQILFPSLEFHASLFPRTHQTCCAPYSGTLSDDTWNDKLLKGSITIIRAQLRVQAVDKCNYRTGWTVDNIRHHTYCQECQGQSGIWKHYALLSHPDAEHREWFQKWIQVVTSQHYKWTVLMTNGNAT